MDTSPAAEPLGSAGTLAEVLAHMLDDSLFAATQPHIPDIELGLNDAALERVETTYLEGGQFGEGFTMTSPTGEKVNRFRWVFGLRDESGAAVYDEGDPIEVDCITGLQFFAQAKQLSKQTKIMKALMSPTEFAVWEAGGVAPSIAGLIGRPVQVDVQLNGRGYPTATVVIGPTKRQSKRAADEAAA